MPGELVEVIDASAFQLFTSLAVKPRNKIRTGMDLFLEEEKTSPFSMPYAVEDGKAGKVEVMVFKSDGFACAENSRMDQEGLEALVPTKPIVEDSVGSVLPLTPPSREKVICGCASKPSSRGEGIARWLLWHRAALPRKWRIGRWCGRSGPESRSGSQRRWRWLDRRGSVGR